MNALFAFVRNAFTRDAKKVARWESVAVVAANESRRSVRIHDLYRRIRRSAVAARFAARRAVRANLTEIEHLRYRLSVYWAQRPRVSHPIPKMQISDVGELDVVWPADTRSPRERVLDQDSDTGDIELARDPGASEAQFAMTQAAQRAAVLGKELAEREGDDREIERQMSEAREKLDAVNRDRDDAIDAATRRLEDGTATPVAPPEPPPSALQIGLFRLGQWALLATEGIFIFIPFANSQGVDPTAIGHELQQNAAGVLLAAGPALLLAAVTFLLLKWAAAKAQELISADADVRQRKLWIGAAAGAAALALSVIWFTSNMRSQFSTSSRTLGNVMQDTVAAATASTFSYFVMGVAAVVGAVILHGMAEDLTQIRAATLQRALTPVAEELVAERRARQLAIFEELIEQLQRRRDINNAKITFLSAQEQAARQFIRELSRAEQHAAETFVDDTQKALATDKYFFRLAAKRAGKHKLLADSTAEASQRTSIVPLVLLLVATLVSQSACNQEQSAPTVDTTVIASPADAPALTPMIASSLATWSTSALRKPGSAALVIVAGAERAQYATTFAAAVPQTWAGGDVLATKAAWLDHVRSSTAQAARQHFLRPVNLPLGLPDIEVVQVLPSVNSLGQPWELQIGQVTHKAVVCDVSESTDQTCTAASLTRSFDEWMMSGTAPMSTFEVWRVGKLGSDARRIFQIQTPADTVARRVAFLLGGRNELRDSALLTAHASEIGSGVAEAAGVAIQSLLEKRGTLLLDVLSDMRQLTPGELDFEQGVVPTEQRFIEWLTKHRLFFNLAAVDVRICGLHHRVRSDVAPIAPRRVADIRELWLSTFRSMQARTISICGACNADAFRKEDANE